ncbi:putative uncharacterized protein DDB_G0277255 [Condylostylus longicornis]|uniref:putative uncharacterized protein DDB_G0277255 n=1 Tax=Condylostylus longicornis TaxID=2530218 RepID=UPI00244E0895|nr:putative uncharacterized protein DDB_G0277255 [Condylostylus longicornis]
MTYLAYLQYVDIGEICSTKNPVHKPIGSPNLEFISQLSKPESAPKLDLKLKPRSEPKHEFETESEQHEPDSCFNIWLPNPTISSSHINSWLPSSSQSMLFLPTSLEMSKTSTSTSLSSSVSSASSSSNSSSPSMQSSSLLQQTSLPPPSLIPPPPLLLSSSPSSFYSTNSLSNERPTIKTKNMNLSNSYGEEILDSLKFPKILTKNKQCDYQHENYNLHILPTSSTSTVSASESISTKMNQINSLIPSKNTLNAITTNMYSDETTPLTETNTNLSSIRTLTSSSSQLYSSSKQILPVTSISSSLTQFNKISKLSSPKLHETTTSIPSDINDSNINNNDDILMIKDPKVTRSTAVSKIITTSTTTPTSAITSSTSAVAAAAAASLIISIPNSYPYTSLINSSTPYISPLPSPYIINSKDSIHSNNNLNESESKIKKLSKTKMESMVVKRNLDNFIQPLPASISKIYSENRKYDSTSINNSIFSHSNNYNSKVDNKKSFYSNNLTRISNSSPCAPNYSRNYLNDKNSNSLLPPFHNNLFPINFDNNLIHSNNENIQQENNNNILVSSSATDSNIRNERKNVLNQLTKPLQPLSNGNRILRTYTTHVFLYIKEISCRVSYVITMINVSELVAQSVLLAA